MPKRSAPSNGLSSGKRQKTNPQPGRSQRTATLSKIVQSEVPMAHAYTTSTTQPRQNGSGQSTRIRHKELLATVPGSVAFAVANSYVMNPGLSASFPWLSVQAAAWEQYRFHKLSYEWVPSAAYTAAGDVMLAPDYDSVDAPPTTELQAATYRDGIQSDCKVRCSTALDPTAMHPMGPRKYVRTSAIAGVDLKTYDAGTLHMCTVGMADTASVGRLWVHYDVELFVPQLSGASSGPVNNNFAQFNLSANQSLTTATVATLVFDESIVNSLGIVNSSGVFTLPSGNWEVGAEICTSGGTSTAASLLIAIEKDNAALTIPCESNFAVNTSGTTLFNPNVGATAYVVSNGSNTVRVRVTYTSVAGTLVAAADRCRIRFRVC